MLNDDVIVYPGHEYLENNLKFTLSIEPDNSDAADWLSNLQEQDLTISSRHITIGDERRINAFMRLDSPTIRSSLDLVDAPDKDVFVRLRMKRDSW
jgi:hydroxyacylglutathione hydrolase